MIIPTRSFCQFHAIHVVPLVSKAQVPGLTFNHGLLVHPLVTDTKDGGEAAGTFCNVQNTILFHQR